MTGLLQTIWMGQSRSQTSARITAMLLVRLLALVTLRNLKHGQVINHDLQHPHITDSLGTGHLCIWHGLGLDLINYILGKEITSCI